MTKLSTGTEYENPWLAAEKAEYLIRNGFSTHKHLNNALEFANGNIRLWVENDRANMFIYKPEHKEDRKRFAFLQSHEGISQLDLNGWIFLMQVMKVQKANFHRHAQLA